MATKARHLKTAMQLWVVDNRVRMKETPLDLARLTGVDEDTARGWESRGKPGTDAIEILERHFGVPAPRDEAGIPQEALVLALRAQTDAITALIAEMRAQREQESREGSALLQFAEAVAQLSRQREGVEA